MSIEVGSVLEGVVTGIMPFGAFVDLPEGKVGLVHISEVASVYVNDVKDFLKIHDKVKVKVISIDERGKIALSIKRLQEKTADVAKDFPHKGKDGGIPARQNKGMPLGGQRPHYQNDFRRNFNKSSNMNLSFEDKMSKFLKDSDERQADLRRKLDSKRGGRGSSRRGD